MRTTSRTTRSMLLGCALFSLIGCAPQGSASTSPSTTAPLTAASGPPTSTTEAAVSDEPSPPSPSTPPAATPPPGAQRTPWLPFGRWATVTADDLRVRYVPRVDDNIDSVVATVDAGTSLLVVGQDAISADGFEWYQVQYGAAVGADGYVHALGTGFVAGAASEGGEQFIAFSDGPCPAEPLDAATLGGLTGWTLAHCDVGALVDLEGMLNQPIHGPLTPFTYEPDWLFFPQWYLTEPDEGGSAFTWTGWSLGLHVPPGLDTSSLRRGDLVRVDGHIDDPAASECRITGSGEAAAPEPSEDQQQLFRLGCSTAFVVDRIELVGHIDLIEH